MTATIKSPFLRAATEFSDHPAIISSDTTLSYREYITSVCSVASQLTKRKLSQGSHIALLADNSVGYVVALMGIIQTGMTACPLSPGLPDDRLMELFIANNISLVIADKKNLTRVSALTSLEIVELEELIIQTHDTILQDNVCYQTDNPALIIQTSGSSGISKSAVLSFGNLYYNALGSNQNIPLEPGDRWLLSLPLYHVGGIGILFRTLLSGATVLLPPESTPLYDCIKSGTATTHLSVVATQLFRLLRDSENDKKMSSLKAILIGGGQAPFSLIKQTTELNWPLYCSYGLTEMASQVATSPSSATVHDYSKLITSGSVLSYRQLRIGPTSEIEVNGETRFLGYCKQGKIVSDFDQDGWFKTGDTGYLNEDRQLFVTGRIDNQFISGGENIQPEQIEAALCNLPGIELAIVVPVPDEEFIHRPVAFIKSATGKLDVNQLKARLSESIPKFMVPDQFFPWPNESFQTGLKPDREQLIKLAEKMAQEKNKEKS